MKFLRSDGQEIDTVHTMSPRRDHQGETVSYQAIIRDVTQSRRLERKLRQAQKMEALGTLAGGIAHDFNNLLQVIISCSEMSMRSLPKESPVQPYLNQSFRAAVRASELTKQILSFSRQKEMEKTATDIAPIVKETFKLLHASLPANIEMRIDMERELGVIHADATQVHQVLMNLCTNAAHAMRECGGVMTMEAVNVEVAPGNPDLPPDNSGGPYVRLSVTDTGQGIPWEFHDRLFEPYFSSKEPGEGTGLGLAVAHGIVEGHGGLSPSRPKSGAAPVFMSICPWLDPTVSAGGRSSPSFPPARSGCCVWTTIRPLLSRTGTFSKDSATKWPPSQPGTRPSGNSARIRRDSIS